MKFISILLLVISTALLTGCGGGGGTIPPVVPPTDTTGPTFVSCTAVYSYLNSNAVITANVTDASGVAAVIAYVNGGNTGIDLLHTSGSTYSGTYPNVPDNLTDVNQVYNVIVYATDNKSNVSSTQTSFTVPPLGPPPPPVL